jgi:hypothetical protein
MPGASTGALAARLLGKLTSPSQAAIRAERKLQLQEALNRMDPLAPVGSGVILLGDVILALPLGEGDQRDLLLKDEAVDRGDEGLVDGVHEGRGGEGLAAMATEEGGHTAVGLEPGLVDVEIHAVDAFDLKGHVFAEDIGDGAR